jgi:hypothetical protein
MVCYRVQNHGQCLGDVADCRYIPGHQATCVWRRQPCFEHKNVLRFVNNVSCYSILNITLGADVILKTR